MKKYGPVIRYYLDHNSTSPMLPEVAAALGALWSTPSGFPHVACGNPSSLHRAGAQARTALHEARATAARALGASDAEVIFTSGGTESLNMLLLGLMRAAPPGAHLITSAVEHPAVLEAARVLSDAGAAVTVLPTDREGRVAVQNVLAAVRPCTRLVSIMLANNEVGTIQPVVELAAALEPQGILLHTDAVQAFGRIPVDVRALGISALSLSGHKFGGPPGIGIAFLKEGVPFRPLLVGGKQERGRRAGTENVPAAVGLATAMRLAVDRLEISTARIRAAVSAFVSELETAGTSFACNGPSILSRGTLPNTLNLAFEGIDAQALLIHLDLEGVAASAGSACSSGSVEPSHVLTAMGLPPERVRTSVRFSFGSEMDPAAAAEAARRVACAVARLRA
jgi:cysteine desulfurase